jgi:hypothetical protein
MPRPANFFRTLAGVSVRYDRSPEPGLGYGTAGQSWKFHCTTAFNTKLRQCFQELWDVCPLGQANLILSAGTYVDKPGAHGLGRAFDLDGILWNGKTFMTLGYPHDTRFYLGVEAILRKHFGTVLNYLYDPAHHDHLHVEDLSPVGYNPAHRSRVLYLQMVLTHLFGLPVSMDGLTGPQTNGAARELMIDFGFASAAEVNTTAKLHNRLDQDWTSLMDECAAEGFADIGPLLETPLDLLQAIYAVLDQQLGDAATRKPIESAVTTFANHSDTDEFLDTYR